MSRKKRPPHGGRKSHHGTRPRPAAPAAATIGDLRGDMLRAFKERLAADQKTGTTPPIPAQAKAELATSENNQHSSPANSAPAQSHPKPKVRLTQAAQERLAIQLPAEKTAENPAPKLKAKQKLVLKPRPEPEPAANNPAPPKAPDLWERRRLAAEQVRRAVEGSSPLIDERPTEISAQSRQQVHSAIQQGASIWSARPEPDLDNGYIIGFDFGTSSLKLAVGQPYQAGDQVVALSAPPDLRSNGHPNLWQAVVWFDPSSERFSLVPEPGHVPLGGFKTGIIGGYGEEPLSPDVAVSRVEAAAAFVAMQLAHALGKYQQKRPLGEVGGDHFLSINIGIPVAAQDDRKAFQCFSRVVSAAYALCPFADALTLSDVRSAYRAATPTLPVGINLIPELLAAISGYAVEPTAQVGAHLLVDVGASTLDIVTFNLIERARVSVFTAGVELLGAAALDTARTAGITDLLFKQACDHLFDQVYGAARSESRADTLFCPRHRRRDVQLLTTGGGCATEVHETFINEMPKPAVLGQLPIIRPLPPVRIARQSCDRSRLLLAFGLTRDEPELLDLRLPSQIDNLAPRPKQTIEMVTNDVC